MKNHCHTAKILALAAALSLCAAGCPKHRPAPKPRPKPVPIIPGTQTARLKGFHDCYTELDTVMGWSLLHPEESQAINDRHHDAPNIFGMKREPTRDEMKLITEVTAESFKAAGQRRTCAEKVVNYYAGCAQAFNTMDRWPEAQREAIDSLHAELAGKRLAGTLTEEIYERIEKDARTAARDALLHTGGAPECADAVAYTMMIAAAYSSMGSMAPIPAPVNPQEEPDTGTQHDESQDPRLRDSEKQDQ